MFLRSSVEVPKSSVRFCQKVIIESQEFSKIRKGCKKRCYKGHQACKKLVQDSLAYGSVKNRNFAEQVLQRTKGFQRVPQASNRDPEASTGFMKEQQRSSKVLQSSASVQQRVLL